MLGLPITNLVVLSGMKIAGLVYTKSMKGKLFIIFKGVVSPPSSYLDTCLTNNSLFQELQYSSFLELKLILITFFIQSNLRWCQLGWKTWPDPDLSCTACHSSMCHGLFVLLTFSGAELEQTSTRPFSCMTMEESAKSKIASIAISPDLRVFFLSE